MRIARPTCAMGLLTAALCAPAFADYSTAPETPALLKRLQHDYGFSKQDLNQVKVALADAKRLPQLVEREQKAPEKTETWDVYARRIDDSRVQRGTEVLQELQSAFAQAETEYGVPPAVIAGILGIETRYGRITGSVRVLDSLATQGFDHPTRNRFFMSELVEFFAFCRDFGYDPKSPLGSYAGAMGAAQFMPSNYRRLSVDFDGDGKRDLWSLPDAIGSIALYLTQYDPARAWRRGEPLAVPATLTVAALPAGTEINGRQVRYTAGELKQLGLTPSVELPAETPVGIVQLPLQDGSVEYWIGLANFYSVMTYNPRVFYGMAVTQLAQRIEQRVATLRTEDPNR
ncbi:lytic murein transglycosylase B [Sinimarinibacterium sp. CAU 1509]|uniref:lytic murein transglycosylase n=1 Tax=Sinimarinibacterium sp. CAU 1509 TaxID=2562283 RepID=UPI0010AD4DBB|nr:lytic murein transglycosylase [Sinimarinibacterium sp. CAU 1509]TJY65195.1 lytic murein transglycosylase B [Sinimarinibacterium sp. CAU 1509]